MIEGGLRQKGVLKDNSKNDLISVITVVYNGEKYIEDTILSVLSQSYYNVEYLIIDGGSKDKTVDVLRKYNDRIDYWLSEPDSGISNAFNKGISLARGVIIGIINADDCYDSNVLKTVMEAYRRNYSHIICGGMVVTNPKRPDRTWFSTLDGIKKEMTIAHPATFVPRSVYNKIGFFNEEFRIAMDYEFILRAIKCNVEITLLPIVCAIMKAGGASSKNYLLGLKEIEIAQKMHLEKQEYMYSHMFLKFRYFQSMVMRLLDIIGLGYCVGCIFKRKILK